MAPLAEGLGPLLSASGLQIGYQRGHPLLAAPLDVAFAPSDFWAVVGPNGAGKSTLVRTLLGQLRPLAGTVARRASLRVGYVPQRAMGEPLFPVTALDVVAMGLVRARGFGRWGGARERSEAARCLARVGLADRAGGAFRELSGGQRQRVMVARALATRPELLVLDEPTDGMDLVGEADFLALIGGLRAETGAAIVMVTHALPIAAAHADRLVLFGAGSVETGPTTTLLTSARLSALYGRPVEVHDVDGAPVIRLAFGGPDA